MVSGERRSTRWRPPKSIRPNCLDMVVSVATPSMRTYVVQPHDTLWSIASSQLGSPLRWPEIAQANYDRPQPDGRALTDAHWIDPGWVLVLPPDAAVADTAAANPAPPQAVATPTPAPAESAPPPAASPPTAASPPAASPPTAASPPAAPTSRAVQRVERSAPLSSPTSIPSKASVPSSPGHGTSARSVHPTTSGSNGNADGRRAGFPLTPIGAGLLGAGLVGIIDRMRRAQQRHRRTGEHIRLPRPALSSLERRLRISDDPLAPYAVDAALRLFAAVVSGGGPVIIGVQVHPDDIELIPEDDRWTGTVPNPFDIRLGGSSWFVARRLLALREPNDADSDQEAEAPCPALVTVGRSDVGPCLVNLEAIGSLAVCGDIMACEGLLRALAVELATSFWADQFDLALVGFGQELSRFERVRVLPDALPLVDELRHRGRDGRSLLHTAGYRSFAEARMAEGSDTWDALMVLCAPSVDAGVARDLVDEVGDAQTGLAVVVCGEAGGARQCLTIDGSGTSSLLDLLGTVVWPQRVDSSELEGLGGLVAAAADLSSVPVSEAPYELITAPLPRVPVEGVLGSEEPPSFDLPRMKAEAMVETAETETVEPEVAGEIAEAEAAVDVKLQCSAL